MPELSTILAFSLAAVVLIAIPGPNLIYITARSLSEGRRAGLVLALGVEMGTLVQVGAAALRIVRDASVALGAGARDRGAQRPDERERHAGRGDQRTPAGRRRRSRRVGVLGGVLTQSPRPILGPAIGTSRSCACRVHRHAHLLRLRSLNRISTQAACVPGRRELTAGAPGRGSNARADPSRLRTAV